MLRLGYSESDCQRRNMGFPRLFDLYLRNSKILVFHTAKEQYRQIINERAL